MTGSTTGQVFNIQRYSIHDGAGIRTLVFLKGCPLRCLWCCNPESQKGLPELGFIESRCVGDSACGAPCLCACPVKSIRLNGYGKPAIDRTTCDACGKCAAACGKDALKVVGREMTVDEVMAEVEKDRAFYRRSGGGVTVGGGEPLAQYRFAADLLEAAQEAYLHTALETCGHAPWSHLEAVLKHVDLLQFDVKHMDPARHGDLTGRSNELILGNLKRVLSVKASQDVIIRIPVIPGCNDSVEDIGETARFVSELGFSQAELIPYHRLGVSKYAQYGMVYSLPGCEPSPPNHSDELRKIVREFGLTEMAGSI
ncbi:MAG: glycyl-radical enzyme activating protein [Chloroflexi bacterium]|nr:glycyl-radical enzyme activating protein [Chloroflexota bacterium]